MNGSNIGMIIVGQTDYGYYSSGDDGWCMHIWSTYDVRTVRTTAGTDLGGPAVSTKVSACI